MILFFGLFIEPAPINRPLVNACRSSLLAFSKLFTFQFYKYISFLAYCDKVENFNIKNAKYDLENYTLYLGDNRTVSNEFLEDDIEVEFTKGKILVIF